MSTLDRNLIGVRISRSRSNSEYEYNPGITFYFDFALNFWSRSTKFVLVKKNKVHDIVLGVSIKPRSHPLSIVINTFVNMVTYQIVNLIN